MSLPVPLFLARGTAFGIPGVSARSIILQVIRNSCYVSYSTEKYYNSSVLFFYVLFTTSFHQLSLASIIQHHILQKEGQTLNSSFHSRKQKLIAEAMIKLFFFSKFTFFKLNLYVKCMEQGSKISGPVSKLQFCHLLGMEYWTVSPL